MKKKLILSLALAGVMLASPASVALAVHDSYIPPQWWSVMKATEKYQDVNQALADGYVPASPCVAIPGAGMGYHYVNFELVDGKVVPQKPEILLYDSELKLVGVEYAVFDADNDPATVENHYVLGQRLNGPMQHEPGDPFHYDLHVWLWEVNPWGIFEEFNPNVSCD